MQLDITIYDLESDIESESCIGSYAVGLQVHTVHTYVLHMNTGSICLYALTFESVFETGLCLFMYVYVCVLSILGIRQALKLC